MNIVQKVKSRGIAPGHNNYQEVTIDAAGDGPIINFDGVHTRNSGLPGFSPIKQTSSEYEKDQENKNKGSEEPWYKDDDATTGYGTGDKKWLDRIQDGLDLGGFIPGIGVGLDLINAGISGFRGDYDRMAMSGVAAIPGLDYAAAGAKGLTKLQRGKKLLNIGSGANPLTRLRTSPGQSMIELGMGYDYANSNLNPLAEQMGLDKDRTSYTEKVVGGVIEGYRGLKGLISGRTGVNDNEGFDTSTGGESEPVVEVENDDKENKKKKPTKPSYGESWKKAWAPK